MADKQLSSRAPGPDLPGDPGVARAIVKFLTKRTYVRGGEFVNKLLTIRDL